jgi:hypothetical protein
MDRIEKLANDFFNQRRPSYYRPEPGTMMRDIIENYVKHGDKTYDDVYLFPLGLIWPYREYTWTREKARRSPGEWDTLLQSMKDKGWTENDPAHVLVGKNGRAKVGEGNHRLAIAKELGIRLIPVTFHFWQEVHLEKQI